MLDHSEYTEREKIIGFNKYVKMLYMLERPDVLVIGVPGGAFSFDEYFDNNFGITNYYRSVKAAGESLGSVLFGKIGVDMGMLIGSVGSPLGGLVGGVIGGVGGALLGQFIGGQLVDNYYRDNKLFIP